MASVEQTDIDWLLIVVSPEGKTSSPCLGQEGYSEEHNVKLPPSFRFLLKQLSRMRATGKAAGSAHYPRALWPVTS